MEFLLPYLATNKIQNYKQLYFGGGRLYRKHITIGKNCTIGAYSIILPSVTIVDNTNVSMDSTVPANWVLENNSLF